MKKTIALLSSLLVFAGIKAQINPTVKKETVNPGLTRPGVNADSLKGIKGSYNPVKLTKQSPADSLKALKIGSQVLKQTNGLPMKENNTDPKPVKY